MSVTFRSAKPTDAAELSYVFNECFTDTFGHLYAPDDLAAFLEQHDIGRWQAQLADPTVGICIAEAGKAIAGYVKVRPLHLPVTTTVPALELAQLYVLGQWHGSGVAATLCDWAADEARRRGARELYLSVFVDNHRARRFYDRRGYVVVGPYAFRVGNHVDEDVIMKLAL